jgi:hypothetical protein
MIKFNAVFETAGDGYWSEESKPVNVTKISLGYVNDEEDFGELRVYFDKNWDVNKDGLIYTDSLFLKMLQEKLTECGFEGADVEYSEQGMQGDNYVSLDVGKDFLDSWFNVVDKVTE